MDRRRDFVGFAWPSFLIHRLTHSHGTFLFIIREGEREGERGFPVELGESNKRVVQNYSTPSRRIYTSTVTRQGGRAKDIPWNNVPRNVPVHHRLHRSSSSENETQLKITSVSESRISLLHEIPSTLIYHSPGNLGSRGERKKLTLRRIDTFDTLFLGGDISS